MRLVTSALQSILPLLRKTLTFRLLRLQYSFQNIQLRWPDSLKERLDYCFVNGWSRYGHTRVFCETLGQAIA